VLRSRYQQLLYSAAASLAPTDYSTTQTLAKCSSAVKFHVLYFLLLNKNKKLSYRRETARQLRIHAQLTRCFSAAAV